MVRNDWGQEPLAKVPSPGTVVLTTANRPKDKLKVAPHQDDLIRNVTAAMQADAKRQAPPQAKATLRMAHNLKHGAAEPGAPQVRCSRCRKLQRENEKKRHENAALKAELAALKAGDAHG